MTPFVFGHKYYKKMLELQDKLRKSEEERIRLEERFNLLEQQSHIRHEACINKLRMRYIEFLEVQRVRDGRNHKLLGALDKVNVNLALMTAKTDRLCILRKEYEASLLRAIAYRRQAGSITGDSGVVTQHEDRQMRKNIPNARDGGFHTPPIPTNIPGNLYNSINTPRNITDYASFSRFPSKSLVDYNERFLRDEPIEMVNYGKHSIFKSTLREPETYAWGGRNRTNDLDTLLNKDVRRNLFSKVSRHSKLSSILAETSRPIEEQVGSILENELERCIKTIRRSLHDKNDPHSLDEIDHEQNTSGDILNVTLSDDDFDHLPAEVGQILALADDLVSRTVDDPCIETNTIHVKSQNIQRGDTDINVVQKSSSTALINKICFESETEPVGSSQVFPKNEINDNLATHTIELNQLYGNVKNLVKQISSGTEEVENISVINLEANASNVVFAEQQEVDNNWVQVTADLESWNLENLKRQVRKTFLNENSNLADESCSKNDALKSNPDKNNPPMNNQDPQNVEEHQVIEATREICSAANDLTNDEGQRIVEQVEIVNYEATDKQNDQAYIQDVQKYAEDPTQIYEYDNDQYPHNPMNEQYQYDPNSHYEQDLNEQFRYDQQYSQYVQDQNTQYYQDQQYHEYSTGNLNHQYQSEAYMQNQNPPLDGNNAYDYSRHNQNYSNANVYEESPAYTSADTSHERYQKRSDPDENYSNAVEITENQKTPNNNLINTSDNDHQVQIAPESCETEDLNECTAKKTKDTIKSILDSDTESIIEKNVSNTESDFDFN